MIRLLRKIRNQLFTDGKYSKYILYASGEIVLVMIGILLALLVNNWNEQRKVQIAGNELTAKLYQELLNNLNYNKNALNRFETQIGYIDLVLTQGKKINIDSLLADSNETEMVKAFTFTTYIFAFTEYYAPKLEAFESSLSDGSIKLVKDEYLVYALKLIYNDQQKRISILYDRELASNENIKEYIADNYAELFKDHSNIKEGKWDEETTKLFLEACLDDGALRYRLQQKNAILKSKRAHLQHRIIPAIEKVITTHAE